VNSADDPEFSSGEDGDVEPGTPVIDNGAAAVAGSGKAPSKRIASAISGKRYKKRDLVKIDALRPTLAEFIRRDYPNLPRNAMISQRELTRYRGRYIEQLLQEEHGEFSELDRQVAESIAKQDTIAENTEEEFEEHRTLGDRASDRLASFGGSWHFLISFAVVLVGWMTLNVVIGSHAYDPYPFILLNLVLSCIAAVQAPIIMMSQKRQESKDRLRADNDYRVNLKAELEIRHLHEKLDYLISRQWQRLAEIQQMQIDVMQEQRGPVRRPARRSPRARAKPKLEPGSEPSGNA
jgi:uncharacterized membrane protein